jgi:predicted TIM-barrel fold metal-dependent hydrolase
MNRRAFLGATTGLALCRAKSVVSPAAIIDTHTHFYDPSRPEGVPWPAKEEAILYRTVLPDEFVKLTKPLGVTGTIAVEASPWLEDNQWMLDLAARNPVIVGVVGHLDPGKPAFRHYLERFTKNPMFRGVRLGAKAIGDGLAQPVFVENLKAMADLGLEVDALGGPAMLEDLVRLTDRAPELRIVINHFPFDSPAYSTERERFHRALRELGARPLVFAKVSYLFRRGRGSDVGAALKIYRPALDELWDVFGIRRLIYGSDWPVSTLAAPYEAVLRVVREYFTAKGQEAVDQYFWKNALEAYRPPRFRA